MRRGAPTSPKGRSAAKQASSRSLREPGCERPGGASRRHQGRITPPPPAPEGKGQVADGLILVGRIGAPQGVRGEVRVQSFTADPLSIGRYGALCDASGARSFAFTALRPLRDNMLVATIAGMADRDEAAILTGTDLFAHRRNLPPPDEDEVYLADLIGINCVDDRGDAIGKIVAVPNFGAGDILEIRPVAGGETLLVPFTKAFVPEIDLAGGRVVIIVPAPGDADDA